MAVGRAPLVFVIGLLSCGVPPPLTEKSLCGGAAPPRPGFAVQFETGKFEVFVPEGVPREHEAGWATDHLEAALGMIEPEEWELTLRPRRAALSRVWFPWQAERLALNKQADDAVLYIPRFLGVAIKAGTRRAASTQESALPLCWQLRMGRTPTSLRRSTGHPGT